MVGPISDRIPARAFVVVGVAGVARNGAGGRSGVSCPVPVGVKVQGPGQLVADAAGYFGRRRVVVVIPEAAHAGGRSGEGRVVLGRIGNGSSSVHRPVAVQVPADGVQLGQAVHLNQAVVVPVIVAQLRAVVLPAVLQRRVLVGSAEAPRVVIAGLSVQVQVPAGIDPGVAGGRLQFAGGFADAGGAGALPAGLGVPVTVSY